MDIKEYIDIATSKITGRRDRFFVEMELKSHIDDRIQYYTDAGYTQEEAEQKAIERMGSPENVSKNISAVHNSARYKKLAIMFNILYIAGTTFGCGWTIYLLRSLELSNIGVAFLTCLFSIFWFGIMGLACHFSHKSQNPSVLMFNGILSVENIAVAPFMYLPTFSTILSLPFEFPYELYSKNHRFEFFYYPLDTNIFENVNPALASVVSWILWVIMFTSVLVPVINAISSITTAKRYNNDDYDGSDDRRYKRAIRFSKALIIIAIISAMCLTIEGVVGANYEYVKQKTAEMSFSSDSKQAWELFDSITIPSNKEDVLDVLGDKDYELDWETYEQTGDLQLIENYNYNLQIANIYWENSSPVYDFTQKSISCYNRNNSTDELNRLNSIDFKTLDEFMALVDRENISYCSVDLDNTTTIEMLSDDTELYLIFDDGKLVSKELMKDE